MNPNNWQLEWDHGAYHRKFHATLAYVKVGDLFPNWTWIGSISDDGFVFSDARNKPIGQWVGQAHDCKPKHRLEDYPVVQFLYQSILPGAYWSSASIGTIYYLFRRHLKSYKIGLSDETYNVLYGRDSGTSTDRVSRHINLLRPVEEYVATKYYEVFTRKLVRLGSTLFADGESIGFMENGVCMLRHPNFIPMVKPLLEDKWQIES